MRPLFAPSVLILCKAILLAGCQTQPIVSTENSIASAPSTTPYTFTPLDRPWSSIVMPTRPGSLLIGTSKESVDVFRISAERTVAPSSRLAEAGFHPDGVNTHDMNGDGQLELLVAAEGEGQIQIWTRQGDLFTLAQHAVAEAPISIKAGDLDADGRADIVTGPYSGNNVTIFFSEANGQFSRKKLATGNTPAHPVITDWDGDGKLDLLWSNWFDGSITWARNLGARQFDIKVIHQVSPRERVRMIVVADVDGDGKQDLVLPTKPGWVAHVFYGDGKGNITRKEQIPAPKAGYDTASFDPISRTLVLEPETNSLILARRSDEGVWNIRELPLDRAPSSPYFSDADGDGQTDLIFQSPDKIRGEGIGIIWGALDTVGQPLKPNPLRPAATP